MLIKIIAHWVKKLLKFNPNLILFLGFNLVSMAVYAQDQTNVIKELKRQYQSIHASCDNDQFDQIKVKIHIPLIDDQAIQNATWIHEQIKQSNRLFAKIKVCFELDDIVALSDQYNVLETANQRTKLGKDRLTSGLIDLFIVSKLADIDIKGEEIRGVHWRNPKNKQKSRWIILSKIASHLVLAHELGHYFDLPHSEYEQSIMNKKERAYPMNQRGFVEDEYKIMEKAKKRMIEDQHLIPVK